MFEQADLICTQCPLADCDEKSLWCLFRLATDDPNEAQKRVLMGITRRMPRRKYFAEYYQANREKKNAMAKERYRARKKEQTA